MHSDQLHIPVDVAEALIEEQFPELNGSIVPVESEGTVNAIFRIGEQFAARFPLQGGDPVVVKQQLVAAASASAELVGRTRVPVPKPIAIGEPGKGYPLPWSIQTWLPGSTAACMDLPATATFALDLAEFIAQMQAIDVRGRQFHGHGRGGNLKDHDDWMAICFGKSSHLFDVDLAQRVWNRLRELPRESSDVMTHGDLIPGNLLVADHRLVGVLDTGGFGPADSALDLVAAWHALDNERRILLRRALEVTELTWLRGMAWAFHQAMGLGWYYETTNPVMARLGICTMRSILAEGIC